MLKAKELRSEGIYAIELIVPNVDRQEAAKELAAYNKNISQTKCHQEWSSKREKDGYWKMDTTQRQTWSAENPEPIIDRYDRDAALEKCMNLLTWIASDPKEGPSIFTKKPEKAEEDAE